MAVRQLDLAVASATVFCTGVVEVIEEGQTSLKSLKPCSSKLSSTNAMIASANKAMVRASAAAKVAEKSPAATTRSLYG